jgi:uncharacterized protein
MATILWQDLTTGALDRCRLEAAPAGLRLSGVVLTAAYGTPLEIRYLVETDGDGLTRRVALELDGGSTRRVLLADGGGRWRWEGGPELAEVAGSLDVDLAVTPATNTLPIRRLGLEVGRAADLRMAWVQFPDLAVVASDQRYERRQGDRWRFVSGDFEAELVVDPDGLVLDYGGLFRSLAYRPG